MRDRIELDNKFREILGSSNVYFQPPESIKMQYPCIRYELDRFNSIYANDNCYNLDELIIGTYISKNPDDETIKTILNMPKCRFDRFYTFENLNHWVFLIHL